MKANSGIALIAVMAALMVLSAIALGLATSVQTEARIDAADWDGLQAEELARSGQEFASFLEARGLRKTADFLAGLPFEAITPGFHYRAQAPTGTVDIYFEADNGKLDLSSAPPEVLTNFFTFWTGDFTKAQLLTAAIEDWRDPDNDVRPNGAEAASYAPLNYAPRNSPLGIADAPLIRGLSMDDFQLKTLQQDGSVTVRAGLEAYITSAIVGNMINPNFAPALILRSVPGLNESQAAAILSLRSERPFEDQQDLQSRIGLSSNSTAWQYLTFARSAPAIRSVSKLKSGIVRSERRVNQSFGVINVFTGTLETKSGLRRIQRELIPEWSEGP